MLRSAQTHVKQLGTVYQPAQQQRKREGQTQRTHLGKRADQGGTGTHKPWDKGLFDLAITNERGGLDTRKKLEFTWSQL